LSSPSEILRDRSIAALEEHKAIEIQSIDVHLQTDITDYLIVASGNSERQLRALADAVVEEAKKLGHRPLGREGGAGADWVLVDLGDVVVHLLRPETRDFYQIERLWGELPKMRGQAEG